MPRKTIQILLFSLACFTVALPLSPPMSHAQEQEIITIAHHDGPHNFNTAYARTASSQLVLINLFETLIREAVESGFTPGLAEKWEVSDDNRVYDFWIRDDAKWSDGTVIDALYAAESFKTLATLPDTTNLLDFSDINISVAQAEDGEQVLRFELPQPSTRFFAYLSIVPNAVLPIHKTDHLDLADPWTTPDLTNMVYSGPYVIADMDEDSETLHLSPNPNFYDADKIRNDGVSMRFLAEQDRVALNAIRSGDLDIALMRPSGQAEFLSDQMTYFVRYVDAPTIEQLLFNTENAPLDKPEIRHAIASIAYLMKEHSFIQNNLLDVTASYLPTSIRTSLGMAPHQNAEEELSITIDRARQIMEKHGFIEDNLLQLRFAINASAFHECMANLIRSRLTLIHIEPEIIVRPWDEHVDALEAGDFDIARYGWGYDIAHPANLMQTYSSGNPYNYSRFRNERFDQIIADMDAAEDDTSLRLLAETAEEILLQQAPSVPIYQRGDTILAQPEILLGDRNFIGYFRFEQIERAD